MDQDAFTPQPPPPVPVIEYDAPRVDQVPRRKYQAVFVVAALFGAVLLGLFTLKFAGRTPAAIRVAPAPAPAPVRVVPAMPTAADMQQQIADARRRANEGRLKELLVNKLPPSQVVYEEDPVAARQLYRKGVVNRQAARREMPAAFFNAFEPPAYRDDGFSREQYDDRRDALLFANQLTSPRGNQRLVLLEMGVTLEGSPVSGDEYKVAINRQLKFRVCETKLAHTSPDTVRWGQSLKIVQPGERNVIPIKWVDGALRSARPTEHCLRFFAGQADPNDPSHFTIDYEVGGVRNTIDGYLTDDDFLRILPRGGTVDRGTWNIEAAK